MPAPTNVHFTCFPGARGPMPQSDKLANLSVTLLGDFRVIAGERQLGEDGWPSRKARSLVKLLALSPGHKLHREQVIEALWPELDPASASSALRKAVHYARHALDPAAPAATHPYLQSRDEQLLLIAPDGVQVDINVFRNAASSARRTGDPASLNNAISLYTGELLPEDRYEEWTLALREELHNTYILLMVQAAKSYEASGDYNSGIEALSKAAAADPLNNDTNMGLMRLLALAGRGEEALRQYRTFCAALEREVGAPPPEPATRLYRDIEAGNFPANAGHDGPFQPPKRKHNLTPSLTSFVGRTREIAEVQSLLSRTRLLTLAGAGGSGKTRLALEVAALLPDNYRDGVWLVELAGISDPALVPQAVASALGVRDQPGRPLPDTLSEYLHAKHLLIVLDNCEHLVNACAHLADTLLRACPGLQILATSREALNIGGETTWLVPPLSLPGSEDTNLSIDPAANPLRYEAIHLFVERATSASPGFRLAARDEPSVTQICIRLDGIPLAIELAAARVKVLSTEQIAERLEGSFQVLAGGSRTALPRHQTLRATIDWSYSLLTGAESALFRRLSVFAGGFTLDAVEDVCSADPVESHQTLDILSRLVEKSLVVVLDSEQGEMRRYRLLQTLRQYGYERLGESGEAGEMLRRHAHHYAHLCARAEPQLHGPAQIEWLDKLTAELDNLRAALDWCGENDPAMGLLLAGSIPRFFDIRGYLTEGRRRLDELLELVPDRTALRARALYASGHLASRQGDLSEGERQLQESVDIYTEVGDQAGLAWSLERLGIAISLLGDDAKGLVYSALSIEIFRRIGYKAGLGWALGSQGMNARTIGDYERARAALTEGYSITSEIGDLHGIAYALNNLGQLARVDGDLEKSWDLLVECIELSRRMRNKPFICWTLECMSTVARMRGDYVAAWGPLQESLFVARELGIHRHLSRCIYSFAILAVYFNLVFEGIKLFSAALNLYPNIRISLDADELAEWDNTLEMARAGLNPTDFEQASAEGATLTWDQASDLALTIKPPGTL